MGPFYIYILMACVRTLHLQASAIAGLSCKPVRPVTRGCHGAGLLWRRRKGAVHPLSNPKIFKGPKKSIIFEFFILRLKPIHKRTKWFANHLQMIRERNACMCGWNCKSALRHLRTVRIPFAANQNLSFCTNTKRTGCPECPFHAPCVLCSSQAHRKLINRTPNTCRMRMAQRVSGVLVYTRF